MEFCEESGGLVSFAFDLVLGARVGGPEGAEAGGEFVNTGDVLALFDQEGINFG